MRKYQIVTAETNVPLAPGVLTDVGRIELFEEKTNHHAVKIKGNPWAYFRKEDLSTIEISLKDLDDLMVLPCSDRLQEELLEQKVKRGVFEITDDEFDVDLYAKDGKFGHTIAIPRSVPTLERQFKTLPQEQLPQGDEQEFEDCLMKQFVAAGDTQWVNHRGEPNPTFIVNKLWLKNFYRIIKNKAHESQRTTLY